MHTQQLEYKKEAGKAGRWRLIQVDSLNPPSLRIRMKHAQKQSMCFGAGGNQPVAHPKFSLYGASTACKALSQGRASPSANLQFSSQIDQGPWRSQTGGGTSQEAENSPD